MSLLLCPGIKGLQLTGIWIDELGEALALNQPGNYIICGVDVGTIDIKPVNQIDKLASYDYQRHNKVRRKSGNGK